jgi:predicted ester cyclase
MTDLRTAAGEARTTTRSPVPVDHVDDEDFDSSTAPPMTNVENPEDPDHQDVPDLEVNKGVALRFIEGVFIKQDAKAVDDLAAEDFSAHTFGDLAPGREPLKEAMRRAGKGVSDPQFEIHDVIAEKDRVAVRLTTRARHTGTFMGLEPSGNEYSIDEIHMFRVADGKVLEHWHEFDKARLMQQLQKGAQQGAATTGQQPARPHETPAPPHETPAPPEAPARPEPPARPGIDARS